MTQEVMHVIRKLSVVILTGMLVILFSMIISGLSGCTDNNMTMNGYSPGKVSVKSDVSFGQVLVDGNGNTLYIFSKDVNGESACQDGSCAANWPSFYSEMIEAGSGLDVADFSVIEHADGSKQNTYKGWPLYYYAGDKNPGDINGDGVGNVWFVAKPDYSIMIAEGQLTGLDGKDYTDSYTVGTGQTVYFTDQEGNTLYIFKNDTKDQNNFTKQDFSNNDFWPIFYTEIESLPGVLSKADFGEIDVYGKPQLTYKGWPLYYFGQDEKRGDTKGVSVPQPGIWPVVNSGLSAAQ